MQMPPWLVDKLVAVSLRSSGVHVRKPGRLFNVNQNMDLQLLHLISAQFGRNTENTEQRRQRITLRWIFAIPSNCGRRHILCENRDLGKFLFLKSAKRTMFSLMF